ncbi:MAG: chorismate synthase [Chloroflexi bacterium]|nr:MAG: chorismate synthase [Chloroflexota bacterium]
MGSLRWFTAGESHGPGLTVIVEGLPAGVPLTEAYLRDQLARRQKGYGRGGRMKIETDYAHIRGGVRHGRSLGSPVALWIENRDHTTGNGPDKRPWLETMAIDEIEGQSTRVTRVRPGHADLSASLKYGYTDVRDSLERASARESAARVAAGAVARSLAEQAGARFYSHVVRIGDVLSDDTNFATIDWQALEASPVRCANPAAAQRMIAAIDAAKHQGDTLGGVVEARVTGVPFGLGSHMHWERKLSARIAQAMLSMNAFKGVEIGDGFRGATQPGSHTHDIVLPQSDWGPASDHARPWRRASNHAGGIEGGISNGEDLVVRVAVKPIATLAHPLPSADLDTGERVDAHYERSDVCVVPAAGVIAEALLALVLADAILEKHGGDSLPETLRNMAAFQERLAPINQRPPEPTAPAAPPAPPASPATEA